MGTGVSRVIRIYSGSHEFLVCAPLSRTPIALINRSRTKLSPRVSFGWSPDQKWKVRAAAGRYYQFPDFDLMFGLFGNSKLKSAAATLYNASLERSIGSRTRIIAEVYDREESNLFFSLN